MIEVKEGKDGEIILSWDENDPVESKLNNWTEEDFVKFFTELILETK